MHLKLKHRLTALVLAAATILGLGVPVQAASIEDGSKTCTVTPKTVESDLITTKGTHLHAGGYTYTTNDGLTGPAYCIDFGLTNASPSKALPITGKYSTSPSTAGAFAAGYPQLSLDTFLGLHQEDHPLLAGMSEEEYRCATQIAVWATLGQLGVTGTNFTAGRETLGPGSGDARQARVHQAAQAILSIAATWDKVYQTGMYIRVKDNELGGNTAILPSMTLEFAANEGQYGIKQEVINGKSYYTKEYIFASATSTYYQDYTIDVWATGAPKITLIINKVDSVTMYGLPDATFEIYKEGQYVTSATTDANGLAYVSGLASGYYEIKETIAPAGHKLDSTLHGITIESYDPATADDPRITIKNDPLPSLRIIKMDQKTGERLPGVTFEIYKDGALFDTKTTGDNGEIFLYDLEPGTYLVKEIATDDAHVVTSSPQQIELEAGRTETAELVFFNSLKPGIHLIKVDSVTMKSLPNVRFEFKLVGGSYRQEFTTDINGEIDLSKLEPGAYEVRELEAPDGYLIDDAVRVIQINPDENANFVFTNTPKPSLRLIKTSSDGTPLAGVHFRIAKIEDGTHYLDRITDDKGEINILDTTPQTVTLFANREATVQFQNYKRPTLKIAKVDINGRALTGAIFEVKTKAGVKIGDFPVGLDGTVTIPNIHLDEGYYIITEIQAPEGYILDKTPHEVYLRPGKTTEISIENEKKPGLTIYKIDSVVGDGIKGAKFKIYVSKDKTENGTYQELDSSFYYTDENGVIHLDNLDTGWYKIVEVEPAAGFSMKEPHEQIIYVEHDKSVEVTFVIFMEVF